MGIWREQRIVQTWLFWCPFWACGLICIVHTAAAAGLFWSRRLFGSMRADLYRLRRAVLVPVLGGGLHFYSLNRAGIWPLFGPVLEMNLYKRGYFSPDGDCAGMQPEMHSICGGGSPVLPARACGPSPKPRQNCGPARNGQTFRNEPHCNWVATAIQDAHNFVTYMCRPIFFFS